MKTLACDHARTAVSFWALPLFFIFLISVLNFTLLVKYFNFGSSTLLLDVQVFDNKQNAELVI